MIQVNGGYTNPVDYLNEIDREFIERIHNKITLYGQIPYSVPMRLIIEVIKESALTFYRLSYEDAKQELFFKIPLNEIVSFVTNKCNCNREECRAFGTCNCNGGKNGSDACALGHEAHHIHPGERNTILPVADKNIRGYAIKLPAFVTAIRHIQEVGVDTDNNSELDESDNYGFSQSSYALSSNGNYSLGALAGINQHLYQYERTVKMVQQNVTKAVFGSKYTVPHDWNKLTHTLVINKKLENSLMLQCICNVPVQYLYEDDLFIKYVYAKCKKELKRLLGGHTFQLPGDVQMSADEICYGADDEIQQVEETLKGYNGTGDIILM